MRMARLIPHLSLVLAGARGQFLVAFLSIAPHRLVVMKGAMIAVLLVLGVAAAQAQMPQGAWPQRVRWPPLPICAHSAAAPSPSPSATCKAHHTRPLAPLHSCC